MLEITTEILSVSIFEATTTKTAKKSRNQVANISNGKAPKTSSNSYLEHFSQTCSTRKIEKLVPQSFFRKGNVFISRRKNAPFSSVLEKDFKISRNFRKSEAIKSSFVKGSSSGNSPTEYIFKRKSGKILVEKEIKEMLEKGAIKKFSLCYKEKRSALPSSHKPECCKSVCALHTLQNVNFADFKIHVKERRLHVQNQF